MPLKLPAWELAGDLDLEARVLIGLRLESKGFQSCLQERVWRLPWEAGVVAQTSARRPRPGTTRAGFAEALWPDSTGVLGEGAQSYLLSGV